MREAHYNTVTRGPINIPPGLTGEKFRVYSLTPERTAVSMAALG